MVQKEANAGLLKAAALTPVQTERGTYLPVDVGVSPFDNSKSHKEGSGRTYKGTDGYAPNFAHVCDSLPENGEKTALTCRKEGYALIRYRSD